MQIHGADRVSCVPAIVGTEQQQKKLGTKKRRHGYAVFFVVPLISVVKRATGTCSASCGFGCPQNRVECRAAAVGSGHNETILDNDEVPRFRKEAGTEDHESPRKKIFIDVMHLPGA